jgi:hypothetical protein
MSSVEWQGDSVNVAFDRLHKYAVVAYLKYQTQYLPRGTEKSVRISGEDRGLLGYTVVCL